MFMHLSTTQAAEHLLEDEYAGWTRTGAYALVEYLEELDPPIEMDRVAFRCEYSEYASACEAAELYGEYFEDEEAALAFLEYRTTVIKFDEGVIIRNF